MSVTPRELLRIWPDGRWPACIADESGGWEVYVAPLPVWIALASCWTGSQ
jgi:hypothetical protein